MNEDPVIEKTIVRDLMEQVEKNPDLYFSISQNSSERLTGLTVFIDQ